MSAIAQILSSVDFWKFALPLLGAVIAWFINEWRKRLADQYQRKEANYRELVRSLRGFYVGAEGGAQNMKAEFLNQLNISWLYCPDEVIQKGYAYTRICNGPSRNAGAEMMMGTGSRCRRPPYVTGNHGILRLADYGVFAYEAEETAGTLTLWVRQTTTAPYFVRV